MTTRRCWRGRKAPWRWSPRPGSSSFPACGTRSPRWSAWAAWTSCTRWPGRRSGRSRAGVGRVLHAAGLDILVAHAGLAPPLATAAPAYLLLEASGPGALDELADVIGDREAAVGESAADRRPAVGLPGTPPGGGRVPRRADQARRLGARRAVGAARVRGGRRGRRRGRRGRGHHLRPRRRRQPAREHRPRGSGGRPPRGRAALLRRLARRLHLGRARHRRAEGTAAAAGPHQRRAGALRADPRRVRPVRHPEPERPAAVTWSARLPPVRVPPPGRADRASATRPAARLPAARIRAAARRTGCTRRSG